MHDSALQPIADKVYAGERLDAADGLALLTTRDVWTLGELAHHVRHKRHGDATYYNVNRHLNYSNLCVLSCKFCEFHRKPGQDGAYQYSIEEVVAQAEQASAAGATEMHIVGGLHPKLKFDYYTDLLKAVRAATPTIHLKAFTAVELTHLARIHKRDRKGQPGAGTIKGMLEDLIEAGLGSLPGGGAEVFDDRVHNEVFRGKIGGLEWINVHRTAHELGLMSNATMLYGHVETLEDRINHLVLLRDAQDEAIEQGHAGRFQTIIPLPFFPDGSELEHLPGPTGLDNLRMLAVCRLMLDNFDHVKCFWIMQTLPMAQLALNWGVDDVDGTVVWYDITKVGGASTHQETTAADLQKLIREAGYTPIERDTLYRRVIRDGAEWRVDEKLQAV
ncbi:aminofutalosine synthase MqnE [Phycisphaeraceae bacterium D3-23]